MEYKNLISLFINNFPELNIESMKEVESWGDEEIPVHVFFGNILIPFLEQSLVTMDKPELLQRIFIFLEKMALSDDKKVREVLSDSILEVLGDDDQQLKNARGFMKERTLEMSHNIEKALGRE
jgi:hypothetical protein